MVVLRIICWVCLGAGVCAASYDAVQSFAAKDVVIASLDQLWAAVHPTSLATARALAQDLMHPKVWDLIQNLLGMPVWLVPLVLGSFLYILTRLFGSSPDQPRADPEDWSEAPARGASNASARSDLAAALRPCRAAFLGLALFSGVSNILMLTGSFYMLEIYDRVLPSRSVPTLVALTILAGGLFAAQGLLDLIRGRVSVRIGASLDEALNARVFDAIVRQPLKLGTRGPGLAPMHDLDNIRSFLSGQGPIALFDLPWLPIYLLIIFAFHPWLGATALFGAVILVLLTLLTEVLTRGPTRVAMGFAVARSGLADAGRRNAEALTAMGMTGRMVHRWDAANRRYLATQQRISDIAGGFGAISRVLRMMLQSGILGVGAYLVIQQEASAGIIIAGAILVARALAPVDLAIANWRGFVAARQSWRRLGQLLALLPLREAPMQLPAPAASLSVQQAGVAPPGEHKLVVNDVSFVLNAGQGLGIVGPSGSGKTSLARMLVGAWQPAAGKVQIDGAALDQWTPEALGCHIGYLPQGCEIFAGTVAENISRFDPTPDSAAIIKAAHASGVHSLVVSLPQGYETRIGEQGTGLSAGQRQRIALARALYGDPFLVVLDEPDANLDVDGELALQHAIRGIRARGGIVVVITHRRSLLNEVDVLLALAQGRTAAVGPRDVVLQKLMRPTPPTVEPFKVAR